MALHIVGAGLAGLLAGNMLRHRSPQIYEAQPKLPNNHSAVLRFRSPTVGDVLNLPFKKVTMVKAHVAWRNPVADALAYAFKNGGEFRSDRSIVAGTTVTDRWIAPPDLISRMAEPLDIKLNMVYGAWHEKEPKISTIPMSQLMELLDYPDRDQVEFTSTTGVNIKASITDCDAYVSLLVPDPTMRMSRISITGHELTVEVPGAVPKTTASSADFANSIVYDALYLLGLPRAKTNFITAHFQQFAKINPINDEVRKNFMHWATDQFNIYSLGRFATWRPGLLLDDLVQDVRLIDRWISAGKYAIARHR